MKTSFTPSVLGGGGVYGAYEVEKSTAGSQVATLEYPTGVCSAPHSGTERESSDSRTLTASILDAQKIKDGRG